MPLDPFGELGVDFRFRADSERVQMIPWRERLYQSKSRMLQPPRGTTWPSIDCRRGVTCVNDMRT